MPLAVVIPFPMLALYFDKRGNSLLGLIAWCAVPVSLWLGINFLSLFQNAKLRALLSAKLRALYPHRANTAIFVGFSRPASRSWIHLHEDIGWLILEPDSLEFLGETLRFSLARTDIVRIRFGANLNTLLGLGRWIVIDGNHDGRLQRMKIEPRQKGSMVGNLLFGKQLVRRLREWQRTGR